MNMSKSNFKLTVEERKIIAEGVLARRTEAGKSQKKVAEASGFASSVISMVENSRVELTYSELVKIALALGLDTWLLIGNNELVKKIKNLEDNKMIATEATNEDKKDGVEGIIEDITNKVVTEPATTEGIIEQSETETTETIESTEQSATEIIEEDIIIDTGLINHMLENNPHGYTVSNVLDASLRWFARVSPDDQKAFMDKFNVDEAFLINMIADFLTKKMYKEAEEAVLALKRMTGKE
jgi:transcriptional regulator with XRE-family HTH domain